MNEIPIIKHKNTTTKNELRNYNPGFVAFYGILSEEKIKAESK